MPKLLFSNIDYYKNEDFIRCLRAYNKYMESWNNGEYPQGVYENWSLMIQDDFYTYALSWLDENEFLWHDLR
jgi:hypothetical protein